MVFKVVSGISANGRSISQLWFSSETINENRSEALNIDSSLREHYKNRFVPNWHLAKPKEVGERERERESNLIVTIKST